MAGKKIKLEEETMSEILFADTDSESGVEAHLQIRWKTKCGRIKMLCDLRVAITNTGQRNHQPCAAVCFLLMPKERSQCISVQVVLLLSENFNRVLGTRRSESALLATACCPD